MGIDRLTAYIIASREDIIITHGGPSKNNGKYTGWITLGEEDYCRPLLNSQDIYDTPKDAEEAMHDIVKKIKEAVEKETGGKSPVDHLLGISEEASMVKKVVEASRNMKSNLAS